MYWILHLYLYVLEGLQRVPSLDHQKSRVKIWLLILEFFLIHSYDTSTGFGSLLRNFNLRRNFHYLSRVISGLSMCSNNCLMWFHVCVALCNVEIIFLVDSVFSHLIRAIVNVAPPVIFIPSNQYSSMTTIFCKIF